VFPRLKAACTLAGALFFNKHTTICITARSIGEFFDAYEKYDRFQGGYVWDWVDQGLNCVDKATGETFWYAEFPL
jgi:hypothetical protein